jgi:hypothetical protein
MRVNFTLQSTVIFGTNRLYPLPQFMHAQATQPNQPRLSILTLPLCNFISMHVNCSNNAFYVWIPPFQSKTKISSHLRPRKMAILLNITDTVIQNGLEAVGLVDLARSILVRLMLPRSTTNHAATSAKASHHRRDF